MTQATPLSAFARRRRDQAGLAWRPPEARHAELFASAREASGAGLALAFALEQAEAEDQRPWLWV